MPTIRTGFEKRYTVFVSFANLLLRLYTSAPRDDHCYKIIPREALAKQSNALLLFVGGHLYRHWWNSFAASRTSPGNRIDLLVDGSRIFVVIVHAFPKLVSNWNEDSSIGNVLALRA